MPNNKVHPRQLQYIWFTIFPSCIEYSPFEDVAYCLPYYIFSKRPSGHSDHMPSLVRVLEVGRIKLEIRMPILNT